MASFEIHAELDPESIQALGRLENGQAAFKSGVSKALVRSVMLLDSTSVEYMWDHFRNPGGQLESGFTWSVPSWNRAYLDNDVPYAKRRNWGFSGKTDALGRFYPNDEGIAWAENSIEIITPEVEDIFADEMEAAINGID